MSITALRSLRSASRDELRARITEGHPVDPKAIEGWVYRGTALGMPAIAVKLTWRTFQKTFHRLADGRLVGWNVRLEQDGIDAPSRPKRRHSLPLWTWPYEVVSPSGIPTPPGFDRGLLIDYARAPNPPQQRLVKDPLVALTPGDYDALLGVSYLVVGGRTIETPTYFTLEREHRVDFVPDIFLEHRWIG